MRRHLPFYLATVASLVGGGVAAVFAPRLAITIAANIFFATYLVMAMAGIGRLTPAYLRRMRRAATNPSGQSLR